MMGMNLDELIAETILALRKVAAEVGLKGTYSRKLHTDWGPAARLTGAGFGYTVAPIFPRKRISPDAREDHRKISSTCSVS